MRRLLRLADAVVARAFLWKLTMAAREFATSAELAENEGTMPSYVTRVFRLTLLAPDIVEVILTGKQEMAVTMARMLAHVPTECAEQRRTSMTEMACAIRTGGLSGLSARPRHDAESEERP